MAERDLRGFYGCSDGRRARVVAVGARSKKVPLARQTRFIVDCPACGLEHPINVSWRSRSDKDRKVELVVEP